MIRRNADGTKTYFWNNQTAEQMREELNTLVTRLSAGIRDEVREDLDAAFEQLPKNGRVSQVFGDPWELVTWHTGRAHVRIGLVHSEGPRQMPPVIEEVEQAIMEYRGALVARLNAAAEKEDDERRAREEALYHRPPRLDDDRSPSPLYTETTDHEDRVALYGPEFA